MSAIAALSGALSLSAGGVVTQPASQGGVGGEVIAQWETYGLLQMGRAGLHLAVIGDPPPDRTVRRRLAS